MAGEVRTWQAVLSFYVPVAVPSSTRSLDFPHGAAPDMWSGFKKACTGQYVGCKVHNRS